MEIRITHSPAHAAAVQRLNALLRENGFAALVTPTVTPQPVRAAQPVKKMPIIVRPTLDSNFVWTEFEPGY